MQGLIHNSNQNYDRTEVASPVGETASSKLVSRLERLADLAASTREFVMGKMQDYTVGSLAEDKQQDIASAVSAPYFGRVNEILDVIEVSLKKIEGAVRGSEL